MEREGERKGREEREEEEEGERRRERERILSLKTLASLFKFWLGAVIF